MWDVASRQPIGEPLSVHTERITSIAYSPDGKTLASCSEDGTIILWDMSMDEHAKGTLPGDRGEILTGKIIRSDETGIMVTLDFFEDVYIPAKLLQKPSVFDEEEKLWKWMVTDQELFMDIQEEIRFRYIIMKRFFFVSLFSDIYH